MASIFTWEQDTPRVTSPWNEVLTSLPLTHPSKETDIQTGLHHNESGRMSLLQLQAEPQDGPVEYKLHLLLRPRRKFVSSSTAGAVTGSKHSTLFRKPYLRSPIVSGSASESGHLSGASTPSATATQQTRQHRLQQLTTQLLWRLQQSSPHHTSSASNFILPSLPDALPELKAPHQIGKLLHGLEESQGALYEIGVADDGTLVGLTQDEMSESLNNLRAMAACLGCTVEVLREQKVGDCAWVEDISMNGHGQIRHRTGKLVVAEALVKPCLQGQDASQQSHLEGDLRDFTPSAYVEEVTAEITEQLRVTLAGPTMSGKSSLLGTLTTSTLDNGRGQSRLSMLKHQHEISSGVTSSVTQELLGYTDGVNGTVEVVNFASGNVASWIDVHVACAGNRLVFVSDSAGHPRYRRTTVKGLIGWAPHWTLLCVPADDMEDSSGKTGSTAGTQKSLGPVVPDMDLSSAQLDMCLKLGLPLVIVITKLDLASRTGLKGTLSKVLDALKAADRKPVILPNVPGDLTEEQLQHVPEAALDGAYKVALPLLNDLMQSVPIVLTSVVQGTGIPNLHALLNELPIPPVPEQPENSPSVLFNIEDVYRKPAEVAGIVASGYLRSGQISVGDVLTLGPFSTHEIHEDSEDSDEKPFGRLSSNLPTSRSFPGALKGSHLTFPMSRDEWRRVEVTSIRNLRLPVRTLRADQVGTLALAPDESHGKGLRTDAKAALMRLRKGMVLASIQPLIARSFVAEIPRQEVNGLAVGNHVVVYIASVRAPARIVSTTQASTNSASGNGVGDIRHGSQERQDHSPFTLDEEVAEIDTASEMAAVQPTQALLVTFRFDSTKEFIPIGEKILIMPGSVQVAYGGQGRGQKGIPGLEGFVGIVRDVHG
ncbi:hypothetical protein K431DRAFT_288692 [Polychaeton citri CBS 116435]|uniref:Tr-type G domain-containing protein n=1 Tax=Polychaeton citri CBS 116435 TaxID=1314669 RepID=A0A9P4Q014_9PEZI|nr:hypothetical protein K431DRAFT_288692 [Polychaeton citri CBS 116435]